MPTAPTHPKIRPVEAIFVADEGSKRTLLLRDTEGIAPSSILVPGGCAAVVARFDGRRSLEEVASELGGRASLETVRALASELDAAFFLDSPRFRERRREVVTAFAKQPVRKASHAGGAYHDDPTRLTHFLDDCVGSAPRPPDGVLRGLCAPHMDLWRARTGYGHAYGALAHALSPRADTFVLLGTSHAPMRRPFAVCAKPFETPLGSIATDEEAIAKLARESRFDVHEDEFLHKAEHSLEFQAVFLRHALGPREARIVPVLCGLGEAQARRSDPASDAAAESFVAALADLVAKLGERVVVVAGADLAHVGPRFGDPRPLDEAGRDRLEERDRASVGLALEQDSAGFFADVAADLGTRRVCGLGPIYTMLRVLGEGASGRLLHYEQCVDENEGSIVSHAALGFYQA